MLFDDAEYKNISQQRVVSYSPSFLSRNLFKCHTNNYKEAGKVIIASNKKKQIWLKTLN